MLQSISVLQMDTLELREYVSREMEGNPVLEELPPAADRWEELQRSHPWLSGSGKGSMELLISAPGEERLEDFLRDQLERKKLPKPLYLLCIYLTGLLDENGYLSEDDLNDLREKDIPEELLTQAVCELQSLDPPGIAAGSLAESLVLQLQRKGGSALAIELARSYLSEISGSRISFIAHKLSIPLSAVRRAVEEIQALDPRPASGFGKAESPVYIIPDVFAVVEDKSVTMVLNNAQLPNLSISSYYAELLKKTEDPEARKYLSEKREKALWLLKSLEQRGSTLQRCADLIARCQADFFLNEAHTLRPMTMQTAAAELGVHTSTVSRALRGKYLQCQFGVFPLRYFFSRSLPSELGTMSAQEIRQMIAQIVSREGKPLSDQKITEELNALGIHIARRTVAKYRKQLHIDNSSARARS